jgi:hypothetical protein
LLPNALASKQFGVAFGINRRVANCRINRFVTHEALNQPQVHANALAKLAKKQGPRFKKLSRADKAAIHELQREKIARERLQASTLPDET